MAGESVFASTASAVKKKRGWPKGKPRGPLSEERKKQLRVTAVRANHRKRIRGAEFASGIDLGSGKQEQAGFQNASPAMWLPLNYRVDDYQYVDYINDGPCELDEIEIRALNSRVVYAHRCGIEREGPFEEAAIRLIAGAVRQAQKDRRPPRPEFDLSVLQKPKPPKRIVKKIARPAERVGVSLTTVVKEMFGESTASTGKPLLDVVAEMFSTT